jgi:hypothetical protein
MEKEIVALRTLSLGSYVVRGELDIAMKEKINPELKKSMDKLVELLFAWTKNEGLLDYLSNEELEVFSKPLGEWTDLEIIKAIWKHESLGVLLWSLSLISEIPPYDNNFLLEKLIDKIPLFKSKENFIEKVNLRPMEEIKWERDVAEHWFWRLQIFDTEKEKSEDIAFKNIISSVAEKAYLDGYIPKPIDGDFPVLGKPFRNLSLNEFLRISYIIIERYKTLNWLCEYSEGWEGEK